MITQTETDADLLERFATLGGDSAFTELVERHGPRVLRVCRRILPNEHDAEEVFQATFLLLARKADSICWDESVDGWLCAAARRLALNARVRVSQRRSRERPFAALGDHRSETARDVPPECYHPHGDPFDEIQRRELCRVIRGALGQLPLKYKTAIELCYLEGKTNAEAARQLGWPAGSMSRRLNRARSLLKLRLVRLGLAVVFSLVCAAFLVLRIGPVGRQSTAPTLSVGVAMRSFQTPSPDKVDLETMLRRIARSGQVVASSEQLDTLSRTAGWVAEEAGREAPGNRSRLWSTESAAMRLAALDLGQASRRGDDSAIVEAARRLDATCIACHEVFGR